MKQRIPYLLFAIGILGVSTYIRFSPLLPPVLRNDFVDGLAMSVFVGLELLGAAMMIRRSRCRRTA